MLVNQLKNNAPNHTMSQLSFGSYTNKQTKTTTKFCKQLHMYVHVIPPHLFSAKMQVDTQEFWRFPIAEI